MGQRHQIYVMRKTKENKNSYFCMGAFHHQWCYGVTAATNLIRLAKAIERAKLSLGDRYGWSQHVFYDQRECDVLVKAIYGLNPETGSVSMVHNENDCLIDDEGIARPERGDNNDGCALVIIDEDKQEVRACLFTPGHVEGSYGDNAKQWVSWTPSEYVALYYTDAEMTEKKFTDAERAQIKDSGIKPVSQREFNSVFNASIKKKAA